MSLSERWNKDVPFIGSDDFYYETEDGEKFISYSDEEYYENFSTEYSEEFLAWINTALDHPLLDFELKLAYAGWCAALDWSQNGTN